MGQTSRSHVMLESARRTYTKNRSFEYVAPTWSWASVSTGIYFFGKCKEKDDVMSTPYRIVGEILNVGCTSAGLDPTSVVSDGQLLVSG